MTTFRVTIPETRKRMRIRRQVIMEFWQYRELFYFLVWRDVKIRYKQTLLGAAWAIIQPLFAMIVFTLFFGNLAKIPSEGIPYPLFAYAALVPWTYFSSSLSFSGNSLVQNASLIRKVYFPRMTIPASSAMAGLIDFGIASLVLVGMLFYYNVPFGWKLLLWIPLVMLLLFLAVGVGMILSALNVKYRDVKYAIPFGIQIWLFITPIIYPIDLIPKKYQPWMELNPLTGIIGAFRASLLPAKSIDWGAVGISAAITAVVLCVGAFYFHKTERYFADLI